MTSISRGKTTFFQIFQSPFHDGKLEHWHHVKCFFLRNRPKAVGDFSHYDSLRWEDQENIKKMVENALKGGLPSSVAKKGGKSKKGAKNGDSGSGGGISANGTIMSDFRLEYAKSGGSKCGTCEEKIGKNKVRIGKKEYNSQRAKAYGPYDKWYMVPCFVQNRQELEYFDAGEAMAGFFTLSPEDQAMIKTEIKAMKRKLEKSADEPDAKKVKTEDPKETEMIKKQMKKIYYYRDLLERNLKKNELQDLLEYNNQEVPEKGGPDKLLDRLSDAMTFGALEPCTECPEKQGQFVFRSGVGYVCMGNMSEWTKCQAKTLDPKRKEFKIPPEFRQSYDFLKLYKSKVGQRVIPNNPSTVKKEENGSSNKAHFPLKGATFVLDSSLTGDKREKMKEKIKAFGGILDKRVSSSKTLAVIGNILRFQLFVYI